MSGYSTDDEVAGPYILWQNLGRGHGSYEGWRPESFNLLEDAIKAPKYNEWVITKSVKLKVIEDDE